MKYITSVSHLIMFDSEEVGSIVLSKGLKQGDLVSLYLFILCIEGL